jgi:GNAT superfamily N-acetyltransferase
LALSLVREVADEQHHAVPPDVVVCPHVARTCGPCCHACVAGFQDAGNGVCTATLGYTGAPAAVTLPATINVITATVSLSSFTGTLVGNEIKRVFVDPMFQKQGFGRRIMQHLEETAASLG